MNSTKTTIADLLYNTNVVKANTLNITTKITGPEFCGIAIAARNACKNKNIFVQNNNKAKYSNTVIALEYIANRALNAVGIAHGVYVEWTSDHGSKYAATCTEDVAAHTVTIHFNTVLPCVAEQIIPYVIYCLTDASDYTITKAYFSSIDWSDIGDSKYYNMLSFDDSLYFESKAHHNGDKINVMIDGYLEPALIKQMMRTPDQTHPISVFAGFQNELVPLSINIPRKNKTADNKKTETKFNNIKQGNCILDYPWDLERRPDIPELNTLDDFVPDDNFFSAMDIVNHELQQVKGRVDEGLYDYKAIKENYVNFQFIGKPGTGKTVTAQAIAAALGMPVYSIVNSKNTEEDTYQGMTKVEDGGFRFTETPFLNGYKNGAVLILEEYNLTDPGIMMGVLGQAIEKPFLLYEDGYRPVRRHPFTVIIATANTGTNGSKEPSEAFTSRLPNVFLFDDPSQENFIDILQKKNPDADRNICTRVYTAYTKVLDYLASDNVNADDVAMSITLRHCLAAVKQITIGIPYKQALTNTIVGTIGIKDLALAKEVKTSCIDILAE